MPRAFVRWACYRACHRACYVAYHRGMLRACYVHATCMLRACVRWSRRYPAGPHALAMVVPRLCAAAERGEKKHEHKRREEHLARAWRGEGRVAWGGSGGGGEVVGGGGRWW